MKDAIERMRAERRVALVLFACFLAIFGAITLARGMTPPASPNSPSPPPIATDEGAHP